MKNAQEMINQAKSEGQVELRSGVYLCTSEYMISEQKTWDEEDDAKEYDFTSSDLFIVTDNGVIEDVSEQDLERYIGEIK